MPSLPALRELDEWAWSTATWSAPFVVQLVLGELLIFSRSLGRWPFPTHSALIASQLIGFALLRYVWKIEPIASMSDNEVVAPMAPNLQRYVDGEIG